MGGACDCDVCCEDCTLGRGVSPCDACPASERSWSSAASASGRMGSLGGGATDARALLRCGVPLTDLRFERREAGDDIVTRDLGVCVVCVSPSRRCRCHLPGAEREGIWEREKTRRRFSLSMHALY